MNRQIIVGPNLEEAILNHIEEDDISDTEKLYFTTKFYEINENNNFLQINSDILEWERLVG